MTTVDNSTIYGNAGLTSASSLTPTKETGVNNIDQSGFLRLMTTQLQYQDPFSPMDNNQMVQQMATFTSLQNQTDGNSLLKSISNSLSGTRLSDAANWIGKAMLVKSDIATPDRSGSYAGELTLGQDANALSIDLVNADGKTVKSFNIGQHAAGAVPFYWDGTDGNGNSLAGGPLQVRVNGASPTQVATWASIAAVQSPASGTNAQLITALGNYTPGDAIRLG